MKSTHREWGGATRAILRGLYSSSSSRGLYASIRQAIDIPVDIHTENPASSGGFIRHYEVPEMIRTASPLYLKTGGSVAKTHGWETTDAEATKRAKQVKLVKRVIDSYYPEAISSGKGSIA